MASNAKQKSIYAQAEALTKRVTKLRARAEASAAKLNKRADDLLAKAPPAVRKLMDLGAKLAPQATASEPEVATAPEATPVPPSAVQAQQPQQKNGNKQGGNKAA